LQEVAWGPGISMDTHPLYLEAFADRFCSLMMHSIKRQVVIVCRREGKERRERGRACVQRESVCVCAFVCACVGGGCYGEGFEVV